MLAHVRAEDLLPHVQDSFPTRLVLIRVDQIIRLDEDAVVETVELIISVVMSDQPADALDELFGSTAGFLQHRTGIRQAFLLLHLAGAVTVLRLAGPDADVVHERCDVEDPAFFAGHVFCISNDLRELVDLEEVLRTPRATGFEGEHGMEDAVFEKHKDSPLTFVFCIKQAQFIVQFSAIPGRSQCVDHRDFFSLPH